MAQTQYRYPHGSDQQNGTDPLEDPDMLRLLSFAVDLAEFVSTKVLDRWNQRVATLCVDDELRQLVLEFHSASIIYAGRHGR